MIYSMRGIRLEIRSFSSPFYQRGLPNSPSLNEKTVQVGIVFNLRILLKSTDKIAEAHKSVVKHQQIFNDSYLASD